MSPSPRWGYTGLILGVSVALGVWLLHQAGWLAAWDGVFYDRLVSWTAQWRAPEPKVLLLRLAREDAWSDAEATRALDILDTLGARAIVIDFLPQRNSAEFFRRAAELKKVVFGRELRPEVEESGEADARSLAHVRTGAGLALGSGFPATRPQRRLPVAADRRRGRQKDLPHSGRSDCGIVCSRRSLAAPAELFPDQLCGRTGAASKCPVVPVIGGGTDSGNGERKSGAHRCWRRFAGPEDTGLPRSGNDDVPGIPGQRRANAP